MRSPKELSLDSKILKAVSGLGLSPKAAEAARLVLEDGEVHSLQEYANTVSIKRLGYNDHGPVHMRTVALNAAIMMGLLREAGVKTSLETEECGAFEDSLIAVILAATLHDLGMSISRQAHELHSMTLARPVLDRLLPLIYPETSTQQVIVRSLVLEAIFGHMGNRVIHSLEAGVLLIADGCDMTKGRARIPMVLASSPRVGDIHKYSANAIEEVKILRGREKPIHVNILMSGEVGLFQVEEVLLGKIAASPAKGYVELYAVIQDGEPKRYL
ncbi:MAG: HD domain-containing protein [Treponema sp.]|jgi:metal-dependent HD superfamily phosphatase/phosphodiesterase|nr:HD domain-containing protein [Treponema sp.]